MPAVLMRRAAFSFRLPTTGHVTSLPRRREHELRLMRQAGRIVASVHEHLKPLLRPGISTAELATTAEEHIRRLGGEPVLRNYGAGEVSPTGFPAAICVSLNDEAVHGIPHPDRYVRAGDLVGLDIAVGYEGWMADAAWTHLCAGEALPPIEREQRERLVRCAEEALQAGIAQARPGRHLGDVGAAIEQVVTGSGFSILRELTGHGIGRTLHEPPLVLNYGRPGTGWRLEAGMTLALEVVIAAGSWRVRREADGWTVRTWDGSPAVQYEHTIAITTDAAEILTLP
jgi:methionyl aminopeptidase